MVLAPGITDALIDIVGLDHVRVDAAISCPLAAHPLARRPDAVVYPGATTEVAHVVRGARACGLAVLTWGGATFLDGRAGRIVLNLSRLNKVAEIDPRALTARVQREAPLNDLKRELVAAGFAIACLPRRVAGRPSVTDHVLALEAVAPSGRVMRVRRTESRTGHDVVDLVTWTDGLMFVITELTLALTPALAVTRPRWGS